MAHTWYTLAVPYQEEDIVTILVDEIIIVSQRPYMYMYMYCQTMHAKNLLSQDVCELLGGEKKLNTTTYVPPSM